MHDSEKLYETVRAIICLSGTFAKVPLPQLDHCEDVTDISG